MSLIDRRSLLKAAALTPLGLLFQGLPKNTEVVLATPADLRVVEQAVAKPGGPGTLRCEVRIYRDGQVIMQHSTSPFAALEMQMLPGDAIFHQEYGTTYRLNGYRFLPSFRAADERPATRRRLNDLEQRLAGQHDDADP